MKFDEIIGNDALKRTLVSMADSGRVPHAMLLYENDGCGAVALAVAFLQYLNCRQRADGEPCGECPSCRQMSKLIHPDVHFVFPVNKSSKVSDDKPTSDSFLTYWRQLVLDNPYFREEDLQEALGIEGKKGEIALLEAKSIISKMSLTAVEDGYKAVLCYLPEKMNADAANRLLKIIEEPPLQTQFLLITHHSERVLRTISSRCQLIRVKPASAVDSASSFASPELFSALMDALMRRDLLSALDAGEAIAALPSRETAKSFCKFASYQLRLIFLAQQGLGSPGSGSGDAIKWASAVPKTFPRAALAVFDNTSFLIDRNVNARLLFTDMVDRLFKLI